MIALVAVLLLLLSAPLHAAETSPAEFIVVRHGALPIVITAPHGSSSSARVTDRRPRWQSRRRIAAKAIAAFYDTYLKQADRR
jgi:hypothetical protein